MKNTFNGQVTSMPLTKKGNKIMANMQSEYGGKKGKSVFYASRNSGKIKGVDRKKKGKKYSYKEEGTKTVGSY